MMFRGGNYLELLAMGAPGRRPYYDAFLARREGVAAVAFGTDAAAATRAARDAAGLRTGPLVAFGRPVKEGGQEARFVTVELEVAQTPEGRLFASQHLTSSGAPPPMAPCSYPPARRSALRSNSPERLGPTGLASALGA